jgi:hypothetical protein
MGVPLWVAAPGWEGANDVNVSPCTVAYEALGDAPE